jgi:hypothetical protein
MLVASKTVLYSLRLGESNRIGFSVVQPEVRFGQNDVFQTLILIINIYFLNQLNNSNKLTLYYFNLKSRYTTIIDYIANTL